MPAILCLETSASLCSVAVIHQQQIFYVKSESAQAHAEVLPALIQECLAEAGIGFKALNGIAISEGPGSYTGLRIGTSTAKGLCFALNIPLIPINTLRIIARAAMLKGAKGLIWAMIDARRMEVFHAVYGQGLEALTETSNGIITDEGFRPDVVDAETVICGDGAAKAVDTLHLPLVDAIATAETMCSLALEAYHLKQFADLSAFEPFYLKQANITASKK